MSYRKITIDGTEHLYTIGRTHVKVRGRQAVLKEHVGERQESGTYTVEPHHVEAFIRTSA